MAVKVTILDRSDPNYVSYETLGRRVNNYLRNVRGDDSNDNENQGMLLFVLSDQFGLMCGARVLCASTMMIMYPFQMIVKTLKN